MSLDWDDILSDNGVMMQEGEAAKAIALGVSTKTALSGGTTSVDVSGMCSSLFESIGWGFCDAVDQVLSVLGPRFVNGEGEPYSADIGELITVAGFTTAVYGATNGEVRLRNGGVLFDSEWIEQRKGVLEMFTTAGSTVAHAAFAETSLDANTWTYSYGSVSGATTTLPHSVDAIGSTDTSTMYYRGTAEYTTNVTLDSSKRYYLYLEPVYQRADVALNGSTIYGDTTNIDTSGTGHVFTTELPGIPVVIDLTSTPFANGGNTITVKTDNTSTYYNIPFNGMMNAFNMLGGATLCAAGRLCFDPVPYGTRRCHLTQGYRKVTAEISVKNNSNRDTNETGTVYARVYLSGSTTAIDEAFNTFDVAPGESEEMSFQLTLGSTVSDHLWDLNNGELFTVKLTLTSDVANTTVDSIEETFGYRTFSASKHTSSNDQYGFTLNGTGHSLYGIVYHLWDRMPTTDELDADWELITALKPQMIRFAYFPALHYMLDKCDRAGIVAMIEIPWMHDFHNGEWPEGNHEAYRNPWRQRYQHNITANAVAMINEFYNHPSVLFFTIGTGLGGVYYHEWRPLQAHTFITEELLPAMQELDTSRLVCIELAGSTGSAYTDVSDVLMERMSSGWGSGSISNAVSEADTWNGKNSTIPVGIMDWSYGANPENHVEWSSASTKPSDTGNNHAVEYPEEYQAYCVEQYSGSALALKWPVFNLYGAMFDFSAANVSAAAGKSGVMQTGLVTRDRSVVKDAYYYLKAMWNSEPMVYVTQKRNMNKTSSPITLRIYTNCNYVKVYSAGMTLLDTIQRTVGSYVVTTTSLTLDDGNNVFYVTGHDTSSGASTCNDTVTVNFEDTSSTKRIQIYSDSAIVNSGIVNAEVLPSTESQSVTWSSDTPAVATVNSGGTVTVLADGTAYIKATCSDDSSVTKTKSIPCYVRGATDSLYYKATQYLDPLNTNNGEGLTYRGVNVKANADGSVTLNGTISSSQGYSYFVLWPNNQNGTRIDYSTRAMFPIWNIPGDQLITCEITGGSITGGTASGEPFTLVPVNETYTTLSQAELKPMSTPNGNGDTAAKLITGSTLGFASWRLDHTYPVGTTFNNLTIRIQSYKQADTVFNSGLLESHMDPPNTVIGHTGTARSSEVCNMYSRNADGSMSELVSNPNSGIEMPDYARVTDGFAIADYSAPVSGATIATAGTVLKFTAIMKNWPGNYQQKDSSSEWSFVVWYADGTEAAKLTWAYQDDDSGIDFTGGTASTTFTATKTVDCAGWHRHWFSWGNTLNPTATCTFYLKLEEVDPTNLPPTSVTAYGSTRIVDGGRVNAVCSPAGVNQSVTWSSSNTSVATIDNDGKVTVVSSGSCTFTAASTLDNTKTGSVTVSCIKSNGTNLAANFAAAFYNGSTVAVSGVTATTNSDGTFTLNGTVSTSNASTINITPMASSVNAFMTYFPVDGIAGDMLVWMEVLGGTVSGVSDYSDHDFEVKVYDSSNSEITGCKLEYQEKPTANGDKQCVLLTGSTAGVRRMTLSFKRPQGTVFDNYQVRVGLKKYSSAGQYDADLLETSLPALCSFQTFNSNVPICRYPNGGLYIQAGTSLYWAGGQNYGAFKLTNGFVRYQGSSNIPVTDVIATSGKTYKFKVKFLNTFGWDSSSGSNSTEFTFVLLGSSRTQLAKLQYIYQNALTGTFVDGEASSTFTATENITAAYIYYNNIKIQNKIYIALLLEEVTT